MNVLIGTLILGLLFSMMVAMLVDIEDAIHQAILDDLWESDDDE